MADLATKLVFYRLRETIYKVRSLISAHLDPLNHGSSQVLGIHHGPPEIVAPERVLLNRFDLLDLLLALWFLLAALVAIVACFFIKFWGNKPHEAVLEKGTAVDVNQGPSSSGMDRIGAQVESRFDAFRRSLSRVGEESEDELMTTDRPSTESYVFVRPSEWLISLCKWLQQQPDHSIYRHKPQSVAISSLNPYLVKNILNGLNQRARLSKEPVQITFEDIGISRNPEKLTDIKINHVTSEPSAKDGVKIIDEIDIDNLPLKIFATERIETKTKIAIYKVLCKKLHGQLKTLVYPIKDIYYASLAFDTPPDLDLEIGISEEDVIPPQTPPSPEYLLSPSTRFNQAKADAANSIDTESLDRVVRETISSLKLTIDLSPLYKGAGGRKRGKHPFPIPSFNRQSGAGSLPNGSAPGSQNKNNEGVQGFSKAQKLLESNLDQDDGVQVPSYYVPRDDGTFASSYAFYPQRPAPPFVPEFNGHAAKGHTRPTSTTEDVSLEGDKQFKRYDGDVDSPYGGVVMEGRLGRRRSSPSSFDATLQDSNRHPSLKPEQLYVKVVKANGLGDILGCQDPYCVVSLNQDGLSGGGIIRTDDNHQDSSGQSQKYMTSVVRNSSNPFWDENFLFDLGNYQPLMVSSPELKCEIFDRAKRAGDDFLGQAVVKVSSLLTSPNQRQIIPLGSRPDRNDSVSGAITVEFLLLDVNGNPINDMKFKTLNQNAEVTKKRYSETKKLNLAPSDIGLPSDSNYHEEISPTSTPDKSKISSNIIPNKYTSLQITGIIKDLRDGKVYNVEECPDGKIIPTDTIREIFVPESSSIFTSIRRSLSVSRSRRRSSSRGRRGDSPTSHSGTGIITNYSGTGGERSRSVEPGKKWGEESSREPSTTRENSPLPPPTLGSSPGDSARRSLRTMSAPPQSPKNKGGGLLEVPSTTGYSDGSSLHSRYSSATYLADNSITVLEASRDNIIRYLILPEWYLDNCRRMKFKGTKLHVFNDHAFVAKRVAKEDMCKVCGKNVGKKFGKSGYVCRDCGAIVHKGCHDRIDQRCPNAKINTIEMIYVMPPDYL